jgi:hypothetical protein
MYYPPPYAYPYPPPAQTPPEQPRTLPYDGGPVRPGYHVEERARRGLLIAGPIVLGVPYVMGLTIASEYDFKNQSGWLLLPVIGPFLTAATRTREENCYDSYDSSTGSYQNDCHEEDGMRTILILDGLTQATGAVLLGWGLSSTVKVQVRNDVAKVRLTPTKIGSGYGVGAYGTF